METNRYLNKSFDNMESELKCREVKNYSFMNHLNDKELEGIDPCQEHRHEFKKRILEECINNYWYFLKYVVKLELDKYNTALHYGFDNNLNMSVDETKISREDIYYRYIYILLFRKSVDMSICVPNIRAKLDLIYIKALHDNIIPKYLNHNIISKKSMLYTRLNQNTLRSIYQFFDNKHKRISVGRGITSPISLFELSFVNISDTIHASTPARVKAMMNAHYINKPFGTLYTYKNNIHIDYLLQYTINQNIYTFNHQMYDIDWDNIDGRYSTIAYNIK